MLFVKFRTKHFISAQGIRFILSLVAMVNLAICAFSEEEGTKVDTSLVGCWHFDEGEGEVTKDSSGRGNEGKIFNAVWVKEGKRGSALKFDVYNVTDDYVNCGSGKSLDITDAITLEAWIKPARESGAAQAIISKEWLVPYSLSCIGGVPGVAMYIRFSDDTETPLDTGKCLRINEWNHVVGTYDSEYRKIYVNGKLEAGPERIGKAIKSIGHGQVLIGCMHPGNNHFDGLIDEVKIYNRALSEEEIITSYKLAGGEIEIRKDKLKESIVKKEMVKSGIEKSIVKEVDYKDKFQGLRAEKLNISLGNNGQIKEVKIGNKTYAKDMGLSIVYPNARFFITQYDFPYIWDPFGRQDDSATTRAMKMTDDESCVVIRGRITSSEPKYEGRDFLADVKSFLFEEVVEARGEQIRLSYEVTADIAMEGVSVNFTGLLPQEDIDDATYVVYANKFTKKGIFSETEQQLDHLLYDDTDFHWIGWLLHDGKGIKIRPESGIWRVMVGKDNFIFFPPKNFFKAKEKVGFSIVIEPLTTEEVDKLIAQKEKPSIFEGELSINSLLENNKTIGKYEKFELTLDISATYNDAFDPDQIDVEGYFTSPSGTTTNICGFLYQEYKLDPADIWHLKAKGKHCWKLRFSPTEAGIYKYYITVKDKSGQIKSEERTFKCTPSKNPGFIRVSKKDPLYFEFDTGEFYYPIGHDVAWTWSIFLQKNHDYYFSKMNKEGINATRGGPWGTQAIRLKVTDSLSRLQRLGYQNLPDNWVLDQMVDSAEKNGIHIMSTLLNFWFFRSKQHGPAMWWENPYNVTRGGVCIEPKDFFASSEAKNLLKRELRYIVARWGYSPAIWTWEMWNENDGSWVMGDCGEENVYSWHQEIVPYLRSIDPWKHLISTSFCNPGNPIPKRIYDLPDMDFTQYHMYPNANAPFPTVKGMLSTYGFFKMFNKPGIIGEFGIASPPHSELFDFFGRTYHYGIWSSCVMPLSGTAMAYSIECIEGNDFYFLYKPIVNFMKGEDRRGKGLKPAAITIDNPSLGVCGIQNDREAQLWVYSRDPKIAGELPEEGVPPFPLFKDVTVTLSGLLPGEYEVEFWDTWKGVVTDIKRLKTNGGEVIIKFSEINNDIAAKVRLVTGE